MRKQNSENKSDYVASYIYRRKDFCNAGEAGTAQAELREQPQIIYIEERRRKKREARTAELARQAKAEEAREAVVA